VPDKRKEVVNVTTDEKPSLWTKIRAAWYALLPPGFSVHGPLDAEKKSALRASLSTRRTLMAADRTLMAWLRTALAMISFGFTIYKLLQGFQESGGNLPNPSTPRDFGLFLTGLGTLAMVMGTVEYLGTLKELRLLEFIRIRRPSFVMAVVMSLTGFILFVSIITRVL
jgi:putative membrane protein